MEEKTRREFYTDTAISEHCLQKPEAQMYVMPVIGRIREDQVVHITTTSNLLPILLMILRVPIIMSVIAMASDENG